MSCFSCLSSRRKDVSRVQIGNLSPSDSSSGIGGVNVAYAEVEKKKGETNGKNVKNSSGVAVNFGFMELAEATGGFEETNMIGEGGFGKVYKGFLSNGEVVAIKQLSHDGHQGFQEFLTEVLMLSLLHHPNLVKLIGSCTDGDQRLLVYEYMPMGSLEDHLFDLNRGEEPLSWSVRMKIAARSARGLEHLHCKADPPVIHRDLKSANILLDNEFNPKLSDFGLAKVGPDGDKSHVSTRVMGTYGYCAPEYAMSGKLTLKSDIYSFGVVLLELITGRRAIDESKRPGEQNLITWCRPFFSDQRKLIQIVDPLLRGNFPVRCLHQAVAITTMCLQEQPKVRPHISDIAVALEYLASHSSTSDIHRHGVRNPTPQPTSEKYRI
ncbi:putative protein kinase RLK-Pelle-RLCK-VIIa-1 family [Lupinus albus]|uniref:Protein kinase domain-containing protein n=1 Tax=Lupinus albus TaxID=3870 RepID=A0A6A4PPJ7_LUPAL|nr:putative protein kinase RLK-Pelle-RLCK-VIIa-1 family [Lupinus albus]